MTPERLVAANALLVLSGGEGLSFLCAIFALWKTLLFFRFTVLIHNPPVHVKMSNVYAVEKSCN